MPLTSLHSNAKNRSETSGKRSQLFKTITLYLTTLVALAVLAIYSLKIYHKTDYADFDVYQRAGKRAAIHDWQNMYNEKVDGASPFRYAPITLPFWRLFASMDRQQALLLWFFIQYALYGVGFYLLFQCLKRTRANALLVTCITFLFVTRFLLDTFTIGQVTALMFVALAASLYAWMRRRPFAAGAFLFIPSLLKIGPALLFGFYLGARPKLSKRAIAGALSGFLLLTLITCLWLVMELHVSSVVETARSVVTVFSDLWKGFFHIVAADANYVDASHYGSQSLNSTLLRLNRSGWISLGTVSFIYKFLALSGVSALFIFWITRTPRCMRSRGLFFSLGVFPFLFFMPQTFKYSLPFLAFPVAFLLAAPLALLDRFEKIAVGVGIATLSLAGLDIIGPTLFFGMQKLSIPFYAMVLLSIACARRAWKESGPSHFVKWFVEIFYDRVEPWSEFPEREGTLELSLLIPIHLDRTTLLNVSVLKNQLDRVLKTAQESTRSAFEILLIPHGDRLSDSHPAVITAKAWVKDTLNKNRELIIQWIESPSRGRGIALNLAFQKTRGQRFWVIHLEQPVLPEFYKNADTILRTGEAQWVQGNRRLPESVFRTKVKLLRYLRRRHLSALFYNSVLRRLISDIKTTDPHSGNFACTREFAIEVFARQQYPGFIFDLELSAIASQLKVSVRELPVTLEIFEEKTWERMFFEISLIFLQTPRFLWRIKTGYYAPMPVIPRLTADDWGMSPGVNDGIYELARVGMIRRVSVLANAKYVDYRLDDLKKLPGVTFGLHYDLTHKTDGDYLSPARYLLSWFIIVGSWRRHRVLDACRELKNQLDRLESLGIKATHMDGHHHMHLAPGLLPHLLPEISKRGIKEIRCPFDSRLWFTKKFILNILSLIAKNHIRSLPRSVLKVPKFNYPFWSDFLNVGSFRKSLVTHPDSDFMTHPALEDDLEKVGDPDIYRWQRVHEFRVLKTMSYMRKFRGTLD